MRTEERGLRASSESENLSPCRFGSQQLACVAGAKRRGGGGGGGDKSAKGKREPLPSLSPQPPPFFPFSRYPGLSSRDIKIQHNGESYRTQTKEMGLV